MNFIIKRHKSLKFGLDSHLEDRYLNEKVEVWGKRFGNIGPVVRCSISKSSSPIYFLGN